MARLLVCIGHDYRTTTTSTSLGPKLFFSVALFVSNLTSLPGFTSSFPRTSWTTKAKHQLLLHPPTKSRYTKKSLWRMLFVRWCMRGSSENMWRVTGVIFSEYWPPSLIICLPILADSPSIATTEQNSPISTVSTNGISEEDWTGYIGPHHFDTGHE